MRTTFTASTDLLIPPSQADREAANGGPPTLAEHDRWMAHWSCMAQLECVQPPDTTAAAGPIVVAAWNLERCKHVEASAEVMRQRRVDIILATEMDLGCARSGQRHTTADLARELGMGHLFGVEFVELALGDSFETESHAGETNRHGLHGNAVLSRFPFGRVALIPLDDGGQWFVSDLKQGQRRVGGRNAVAAEILAPCGAFWAVSVHFESQSTPASRAEAARRLIAALAEITGGAPTVIGGDFNVFAISRSGLSEREARTQITTLEPTFAVLEEAGFAWREANSEGPTTRPHLREPQDKPRLHIDWIFLRGLSATDPWTAPAVSPDGTVLSDHDSVGITIGLGCPDG